MANEDNLRSYQSGENRAKINGAKGGRNKKGSRHISTWIHNMLSDPNFELKLKDGTTLKGAPLEAIIKTAIAKGISGNVQWAEWLAKHGYGDRVVLEVNDPIDEILSKYGLTSKEGNKKRAGKAKTTKTRSSKNSVRS